MAAKRPRLTLVLYPNTFGICYVMAENTNNIVDYGIKRIHPLTHRRYVQRIDALFEYAKPELVILRDHGEKQFSISNRIKAVVQEIHTRAIGQDLQVHEYTRSQIREVFALFEVRSKYDIAEKLIEWYPFLKARRPHRRNAYKAEHYQMGVFDAFSLLITHNYLID